MNKIIEFLSKNKVFLLYLIGLLIVASVSYLIGTNVKTVNSDTNKIKIEEISRIQKVQLDKIDSVNKVLYQIQLEQSLLSKSIDKSLKAIDKLENERLKKVNTINTAPIDGTVVFLRNRYSKLSKDSISR